MDLYSLVRPEEVKIPILFSSPHSGTFIPESVGKHMVPDLYKHPQDTDWFIDQLYNFAPEMGALFICSNYSRYVVDLNRDPESKRLYNDSRSETTLTPVCSFSGDALYLDGYIPDAKELQHRINYFYKPYYQQVEILLQEIKAKYGYAIFFDCHSIKRTVKTIQADPFPDLILGNQEGKTADDLISKAALGVLSNSPYQVSYNHPFKGGYLTRNFGRPEQGIHALQLEMSQDLYMDEVKTLYLEDKASQVRHVLKNMINEIVYAAKELYE